VVEVSAFERFLDRADRTISFLSIFTGWIALLTLGGLRVYEVVARQYTIVPSGLLRFYEFTAFALMVILAFGYTYLRNGHVRVDIFRSKQSPRTQAWFEVGGGLLALLPFCLVMIGLYVPYIQESMVSDISPVRTALKTVVPFGLGLLALAGLITLARNILFLTGRRSDAAPEDRPWSS
jgi:TRAP-type mannitol/chloroaromatic compound transport system permease small subunit